MATIPFLSNRNIGNIWDVIYDEEVFRFLEKDNQEKIYKVFINNINGFYLTNSNNINNTELSLVDLNKKYILLILNHIKDTYILPKKITIHHQPSQQQPVQLKELITFEDIQTDRKSKMESAFIQKQTEFEDMITLKPPQKPDFLDSTVSDRPIKEMDKILKEMQAQRKYDVDQLTSNNNNNTNNKKTVSFEVKEEEEEETEGEEEKEKEDSTLFSKLKKINPLYEQISDLEAILEQACLQLASIKKSISSSSSPSY